MNGRVLNFFGWLVTAAFAGLLLLACSAQPCTGQIVQGPPVQTVPGANNTRPTPLGADRTEGPGPLSPANQSRLEHLREDDRHKRIMADTARLVALTNELKEYVEKTSKDELSLEVVRKAAEIEKLAHDVKERMRS